MTTFLGDDDDSPAALLSSIWRFTSSKLQRRLPGTWLSASLPLPAEYHRSCCDAAARDLLGANSLGTAVATGAAVAHRKATARATTDAPSRTGSACAARAKARRAGTAIATSYASGRGLACYVCLCRLRCPDVRSGRRIGIRNVLSFDDFSRLGSMLRSRFRRRMRGGYARCCGVGTVQGAMEDYGAVGCARSAGPWS